MYNVEVEAKSGVLNAFGDDSLSNLALCLRRDDRGGLVGVDLGSFVDLWLL